MESGIYQIRNLVNGKKYIGSAKCFRRRWAEHKKLLRKDGHHSKHLQAAWNKYGEENFTFEVILECEVEELIDYEQLCIDEECPEYNICRRAGNSAGTTHTEEAKLKMSKAKKGRTLSEEHKRNIGIAGLGRAMSDSAKKLQSEAHKNISDETRKKMSIAQKGKTLSEEHKRKISEASKGRPARNKGKQMSAEARQKMSEAHKGSRPWNEGIAHSEETKRKISEARKRYFERKKMESK